MQKKIVLVVPCYNEEARLKERLERFLSQPYTFVFVNDGSADGTRQLLEGRVRAPHTVLNLPRNSGKAEAVRQGMLSLKERADFAEIEWAGYWDADLATPLEEVERFIDFADFTKGADAVYGSRVLRLGGDVRRSAFRHILGRVFCTTADLLFGLGSYDTQCGAKLFRRQVLETAFGEPFVSPWLFDIEILLRLKKKGCRQIEYPLASWTDVRGSKLNVPETALRVLADLVRIYRKGR